jgi:rod shape determining protein RodA
MLDKKYIKNLDFVIPIVLFLLTAIGALGIGISMRPPTDGQEQGIIQLIASFNLRHVNLHFLWFMAGLVIMVAVIAFDYKNLYDLSAYIYWVVIAALIYVDLAGDIAGGAQSWIDFGAFKFQPSEFAKLSVIITLARLLSLKEDGIKSVWDLFPIAAQVGIPLVLIVLQPDFGTFSVIFTVSFGMLYLGGLSYKLILGISSAAGAGLLAMWFTFLTDEQKSRIFVFLNPEADAMGSGYQVMQSITAIGSGRIFGKNIFDTNMLSQLDFIPAKHTDFIFSVTGEAFGFLVGALVIILYTVLIFRSIMIAATARDKFGSMLASGVASMIMFHVFINIGMTMGLVPVTGIPLPFMSYGGSSMLTNLIAFGMVLNVGMRRQKTMF